MTKVNKDWEVNPEVVKEWPEKNTLFLRLFTLGDVIPLKFKYNAQSILKQLEPWEEYWQKYNPRDGGIARYGLPYTSLDGNVVDPVNTDSLNQYNTIHGTRYLEKHFCHLTDVGKGIPELQPLNELLGDDLHRSHFLRLSKGGYFPPHRDAIYNISFRLIIPLDFSPYSTFFMIEEKPINFINGRAYLVNTVKRHSVFSMQNHMQMLVLNVNLSDEILIKMYKNIDGI